MSSALERHRAQFAADPSRKRSFEALEEHEFLSGEWEALVELYRHRLTAPDVASSRKARAGLLFRLGQILEERCGQPDQALACYREAAALAPRHTPVLRQIRRLCTARGRWDLVLQFAEMEANAPMRPTEEAAFHTEMAAVWAHELDDPAQALALYRRATRLDPENTAAVAGCAACLEALGRERDAADSWRRVVDATRGAERAHALVSLARLLEGALGEPERAVDLYRRALTDDPRNPEAVEALVACAKAREQWLLVADLQERRFDLASGATRRAAIAMEAGRLHLERLGDAAAARPWFARAVELRPEDPEVHLAAAEVARASGDRDGLLARLDRFAELSAGSAPPELLLEAAALHGERGEDELAIARLREALAVAPESAGVMDALAAALRRTGAHEELADLLERRAALVPEDPGQRAAVLAELGAIHEQHGNDPDAACDAYERSFAAQPRPATAAALERIHRKQEQWRRLHDLLERGLSRVADEERVRMLCVLGEVRGQHLDDAPGAQRAYEEALGMEPERGEALRGLQELALRTGDEEALLRAYAREARSTHDRDRKARILSELAERHEQRGEAETALEWAQALLVVRPDDRRALETCARLHEVLGQEEALIAVLRRLDAVLTGIPQAANRRRLAVLYTQGGREAEAIEAYQAALEADARDRESLSALVGPLERARRYRELAAVERRLAELLPEPDRSRCLRDLAELLSERLGDLDAAIVVLWRIDDPDDDAVADRLDALLERAGRFAELAQHLLERRQRKAPGSPEAVALDLRRAALLLDRLGQVEEAGAVFRDVRDAAPDSQAALDGLERALRALDDAAGLVGVLAERAQAESDPTRRGAIELERAILLDRPLGRCAEAREALAALADGSPDPHVAGEAAIRLERQLEREGDLDALCARLRAKLGRASPEADARLHLRLARLARDRRGDPEAAIEHFEAAARIAPAVETGEAIEIWESLAALYEQAGRPDDWLRALEALLQAELPADTRLRLSARAARLCHDLGRDERARDHFERVRELDPGHADAVQHLADHLEREARWPELATLLEGRLRALFDPDAPDGAAGRTALRLRIASLEAGPLAQPEAAAARLEAALRESGPGPLVAEPLAALYERLGREADRIALCEMVIAACEEPAERGAWQRRLGDALLAQGRDDAAATVYGRALADRPGDRDVESALRDIHRRRGEPAPLARLLELELSRVAGADEVPLRFELATLLCEALDRPEDALLHLRRVLEVDPAHEDALKRALSMAEALGRHEETLELLGCALARTRAAGARAAHLARQADLLAGPLGRPEDAVALYREALSLDPELSRVRQAFRRVLEELERWPAVLDCLHVEASRASHADRADLLEEAAGIAATRISDDAALPWLERLRALRPGDASVAARIASVHRRAGRPEALLRALEEQLELETETGTAARRAIHLEQARILETELQSPGRATAVLERARAEAPDDTVVLRELARLYEEAGRLVERVEVIEALIPSAPEEERAGLRRAAADLLLGPLADPGRAAAHLSAALQAEPRTGAGGRSGLARIKLLQTLGAALRAAGRLDAWARAAEDELSALDPEAPVFAERRRELHRELAWAYDGPLACPDAAVLHLRAFLDTANATQDAAPAERQEAEAALLRRLRVAGDRAELARRLAMRVEHAPEDVDAWQELARLREEHLHAPVSAARAYGEVLKRRPGSLAALRGLRRVSERSGDWGEVASTLERELELAESRPVSERGALLRRLGEVAWHRLQSTTRASRAFAAALEADPGDLAALRALTRLFETMEDWRGALDLYESEIEVLGDTDSDRRREVWLRIGEIARDRTNDAVRAVRAYEQAAALGELETRRWAEAAELYRRLGDLPRYVEASTRFCDTPNAGATADDHLALARALEEIDRPADALARVERALAIDRGSRGAWDAAARLRQAVGDAAGAAEALVREAELTGDREGASGLLRAAELLESQDAERALSLLRRAVERDAASSAAVAALARSCSALGRSEEVVDAAARALDLESASPSLDTELLLATAVRGGDAARELGRLESAARFYDAALAAGSPRAETLAAQGEVLFEIGDLAGARRALEARIALPGDDGRARHELLLGAACEALRDADAAIEHYRAALALDSALDDAHEGLVRLHEDAGRIDDAISALELAAARAADGATRAARLVRAAELRLARGDRSPAANELGEAEALLREATAAEPARAGSWLVLAERLVGWDRLEDAGAVAADALEHVQEPAARGCLSLIRARALEACGDRREAADVYDEAARAGSSEAALARARLLRALGEWAAAAETLAHFARRAEHATRAELAEVHLQLGRLRAGPLEHIEGAIDAYRRALDADPDLHEAREALGGLLVHRPALWDEALALHRDLLSRDPVQEGSLRSILRIAEGRGRSEAACDGLALLRAIGIASPEEHERAPEALAVRVGSELGFENPLWERVRRVARDASAEIAEALGASPSTADAQASDDTAAFRTAALAAEGRLAGPALVPLSTDELATVLRLVARLALDPDHVSGDGRLVNALSAALGRRARRRVRRALADLPARALDEIDFAAWRAELRSMARAAALDATGGRLRTALLSLIGDTSEVGERAPGPEADLRTLIAPCPEARDLLRRVVHAWSGGCA